MSDRWVRLLSPLALLALFAIAGRGLPAKTKSHAQAIDCDRTPKTDVPALQKCLAMEPDDLELMSDLGAAFESAGKWDSAEAQYRRALSVDPQYGDVHVALGRVLLHRGDRAGARKEAEAALTVQPASPAARALIERAGSESGQ